MWWPRVSLLLYGSGSFPVPKLFYGSGREIPKSVPGSVATTRQFSCPELLMKLHMNVNFRDKNFVISTGFFFVITSAPRRPRGQFALSLRPQFLHVALGLVSVKRNEIIEITLSRFEF